MEKIKSLADLKRIKENVQAKIDLREKSEQADNLIQIKIAMATCGIAAGARPVRNTLAQEVQTRGLTDKISVTQTGCIGLCQYEPIVEVMEPGKDKVTYVKMNADKAVEIVERHLIGGHVVEKYTMSAAGLK